MLRVKPGEVELGLPRTSQQLSKTPLLDHVHLPTSLPAPWSHPTLPNSSLLLASGHSHLGQPYGNVQFPSSGSSDG